VTFRSTMPSGFCSMRRKLPPCCRGLGICFVPHASCFAKCDSHSPGMKPSTIFSSVSKMSLRVFARPSPRRWNSRAVRLSLTALQQIQTFRLGLFKQRGHTKIISESISQVDGNDQPERSCEIVEHGNEISSPQSLGCRSRMTHSTTDRRAAIIWLVRTNWSCS
jgi:hypothetical protein